MNRSSQNQNCRKDRNVRYINFLEEGRPKLILNKVWKQGVPTSAPSLPPFSPLSKELTFVVQHFVPETILDFGRFLMRKFDGHRCVKL